MQSLTIAIGQVPLTLHFHDSLLLEKARERYRAFQSTARGMPVFVNPDEAQPLGDSDFSYTLDHTSLFLARDAAQLRGVSSEFLLDSMIRILLSALLLPRRGLLLHAGTVLHRGKGYVFMGRSGEGKSTVAALSFPRKVLTDEISIVRLRQGRGFCYGTPFWGEFRCGDANLRALVAGIYRLVKSADDHLERLSPKEALRVLLPNVLFFSGDKAGKEQLLRVATELVSSLPVYRLQFRHGSGFWEIVERGRD